MKPQTWRERLYEQDFAKYCPIKADHNSSVKQWREDRKAMEVFFSLELQRARKEGIEKAIAAIPKEKEEGQTEQCEDVLAMNYLIGRNKGWNECRSQTLTALRNITK